MIIDLNIISIDLSRLLMFGAIFILRWSCLSCNIVFTKLNIVMWYYLYKVEYCLVILSLQSWILSLQSMIYFLTGYRGGNLSLQAPTASAWDFPDIFHFQTNIAFPSKPIATFTSFSTLDAYPERNYPVVTRSIREGFRKKSRCSFGICLNEGGSPAQTFCHLFMSAFLGNKRNVFPPKCQ